MKAAVLIHSREKLKILDITIPKKLEYGQVHVKISYSGICGSQINEIDAKKGKDKYLPHLLGHEASGIVLKIGPGVTKIKQGDHVVLHWRIGRGIEGPLPEYRCGNIKINSGYITTFNKETIISENRITPIPKEFDLRLAALFGCSITTAFGVINNDAQLKIGQSVLIFGLGGVGLSLVQGANLVSAHPIIGIDIKKNKILNAKKFGLTRGFVGSDLNTINKLKKILNIARFDVVIDTTGNKKIIELAYDLTDESGKTILVGVPNKNVSIYTLPLHFKKIIKGSHGGGAEPSVDIPNYIKLINSNKLYLNGLIAKEYKLKDINLAIKKFRTGVQGKILINMND